MLAKASCAKAPPKCLRLPKWATKSMCWQRSFPSLPNFVLVLLLFCRFITRTNKPIKSCFLHMFLENPRGPLKEVFCQDSCDQKEESFLKAIYYTFFNSATSCFYFDNAYNVSLCFSSRTHHNSWRWGCVTPTLFTLPQFSPVKSNFWIVCLQ